MTALPCANTRQKFGKHELVITARQPATGLNTETFLIIRTIKCWLYLAGLIENGQRLCKEDLQSVENVIHNETGDEYEFTPEPRVTVFNWNHELPGNIGLTIHSDTFPQNALSVWWATYDALQELEALQNAQATAPQASTQGASTPISNPPTQTPVALVSGVVAVNGKKAGKELPIGQQFSMKIVKVMSVMSRTGIQTFELYCAYGSKPGEYADLLVYSDNEFSVKNGVVAALNALNLKPGSEVIGEWFVTGLVYESKGKKGLDVRQFEAVEP